MISKPPETTELNILYDSSTYAVVNCGKELSHENQLKNYSAISHSLLEMTKVMMTQLM